MKHTMETWVVECQACDSSRSFVDASGKRAREARDHAAAELHRHRDHLPEVEVTRSGWRQLTLLGAGAVQ